MSAIALLKKRFLILLFLSMGLWGQALAQGAATQPFFAKTATHTEYRTVDWPDLIPQEDLDALLNPPAYISEIEDGSFEDQISSQIQNAIAAASDDRYQQALVSTRIKPEMNGQAIRIPGFIVPLEFTEEMMVTELFIVPYFGACIHVPPPPPNQIIHVEYPEGFHLEELYYAFWVSGVLKTSLVENDMAIAAYTMDVQRFEVYSEE